MTRHLPILSFNDVYRVSQRFVPQPGSPAYNKSSNGDGETISVSQFGHTLFEERDKWADRKGDRDTRAKGADAVEQGDVKDGLVLFAGDVFNPSVESSVTRGSHMVSLRAVCVASDIHNG